MKRLLYRRGTDAGRIPMEAGDRSGDTTSRRNLGLVLVIALTVCFFPGCGGGGGKGGGDINGGIGPRDVYVGATLSPGFDMGVDSSGGQHGWVTADPQGFMTCTAPANQQWAAVFITAGPVSPAGSRTYYDYSSYNFLVLDLKGASGGEQVSVGMKTEKDPDDGNEPRNLITNLTTNWQTIRIPLSSLIRAPSYPLSRFLHLYVVLELVFPANTPETVYFRNAHYEP